MKINHIIGIILGALLSIFVILPCLFKGWYVVEPGTRGILVTLGKVYPEVLPEGFGIKNPYLSNIIEMKIRQVTVKTKADCFSSDLQQVDIRLDVLYRIPEQSVIKLYKDYAGEIFEALIEPRLQEALKEVTATMTAEQIAKKREEVKVKALALTRNKVGDILVIADVMITDIGLSKELGHAIEAKMVQEQETAKAKFKQQQAEIDAQTAIIKAKGEAESISIKTLALKQSPELINLTIAEKWDGKAPLVVGGSQGGASVILPLEGMKR